MTEEVRRLPAPWSVEEQEFCFVIRDANNQRLTYIYFDDDYQRRAAGKLLTREEARRVAVNIIKLPALLGAK